MAQDSKANSALGLERFSGNMQEFTMWKDKVRTHIDNLDQEYQRKLLEKDQPDATVLMATFLDGRPVKPVAPAGEDVTASQARDGRWELAHWNRARVAMQNLFNQALPNGFLSTLPDTVSKMDPCEVWALLEQAYGLGDAAGLIELMKQWGRVLATNWKDAGSLFARLKKLRNEINRKTKALVGQEMVTEAWLCIEVLSQLPSELWASSVALTNKSFNHLQR